MGLANPQFTDYKHVIEKNFPPEMRESIRIFHLRGAIDYKNINITPKAMMAMLKKKVSEIEGNKRAAETKMMLDTFGQTVDFTDKMPIKELVGYCKR